MISAGKYYFLVILLVCYQGVSGQSDARQIGLIAGCAGGAVVLLILLVAVCCIVCRRKKEKQAGLDGTLNSNYPLYLNQGFQENNTNSGLSKGSGTKSAPSSDMSTQLSVPPGLWQNKPTMYAGHPAQAYVLAHNRDSPREAPPLYNSYSNEPMLTPRKSHSKDQDNADTSQKVQMRKAGQRQPNGTAVRDMEQQKRHSQQQRTEDNGNRHSSSNSQIKPQTDAKKAERKSSSKTNLPEDGRSQGSSGGRGSSSLQTRLSKVEGKEKAVEGPYIAKAYSNYRQPPRTSVQDTITSENPENVAKVFSSYQNISSNRNSTNYRDPYIARAQVKNNRYSAEILQSSKKQVQVMTQSDFSLNRPGKPLGRTNSEMVKNGAGYYRAMTGKNTAPPQYYGNRQVILTPGNLMASRNPYGRGVLMRANTNVSGPGYRQMHSLDRFQVANNNRAGGLKERSVFAAPDIDQPEIVRGNFIMRSNTFTPQDTSAKPIVTTTHQGKVASSNQVVSIKRDRAVSDKRPAKGEGEKHQRKSAQKAPVYRVKSADVSDAVQRKTTELDSPANDPIYAQPKKISKKAIPKAEINNNDVSSKPRVAPGDQRSSDVAAMVMSAPNISSIETDTPVKPSPKGKQVVKQPIKDEPLPLPPGSEGETRKRLKSVSSADLELKEVKAATTDAFKFLEDFDDGD